MTFCPRINRIARVIRSSGITAGPIADLRLPPMDFLLAELPPFCQLRPAPAGDNANPGLLCKDDLCPKIRPSHLRAISRNSFDLARCGCLYCRDNAPPY